VRVRSRHGLVVLALTLSACVGERVATPFDDALITGVVKTRLVREYAGAWTRIDVDTQDGVVYLRGRVPSDAMRQRAEDIALSVRPVWTVVNELRVEPDRR
jgi:osmotically-inducible protein OsmY